MHNSNYNYLPSWSDVQSKCRVKIVKPVCITTMPNLYIVCLWHALKNTTFTKEAVNYRTFNKNSAQKKIMLKCCLIFRSKYSTFQLHEHCIPVYNIVRVTTFAKNFGKGCRVIRGAEFSYGIGISNPV